MSRLTVFLLATSLSLLSACSLTRPTQPPDIRLAGLQPERIGLTEQVFLVELRLENPNTVKLRVASGQVELEIESAPVGIGELVEGFDIPAGEQGSATVRVVTDIVANGPRFLEWLMSGDTRLDYRVIGHVDVVGFGLGRLPIDERGQFVLGPPGPRPGGAETLTL